MSFVSRLLAAPLAIGLVAAPAMAAEQIGFAIVIVNQVTAKLDDLRTLRQGDGVHQNELIEVAKDASSELKLNDETKMALGSGAKLMLDKFVYDGEKQSKGDIAVNLMKGAFRFVTGVAAKPSYVVRVPQASITVRGTIFDVYVQDNGVTWLLLHEGAVTVCNARGKCRDLDEPGKLIRINDGDVGAPSRWTNLKQKTNFDDAFPFVDKKPQDSPPVLTRDAILIDIGKPKRDKPTKKADRDDDDDRAVKTKKKRTEKADRDDDKPKRKKVSRRDDDDDDDDRAAQAIGLGLAIGGGIRFGKGGGYRGDGGGGGGGMGGNRSTGGMRGR